MKMPVLPFERQEPRMGLMRLSGMMHLEGDSLILEYQKTDNLVRLLKLERRELVIPLADLIFADAHSNIFKSYFHLRVSRFGLLSDVFDNGTGEVKLKIRRADRDLAFDIADEIRHRQNNASQHRLA